MKLEPCPWCPTSRVEVRGWTIAWVACDKCNATGPVRAGRDEACAAWNSRATPPALAQAREALEAGANALHNAVLAISLEVAVDHDAAYAGAKALAILEAALRTLSPEQREEADG